MEVFFEPIETQKIYLKVVDQILELIRAGKFQPGDKLPAERVMAQQMGISRPAVREAIAALEIVGILETRPGQGTFITSADFNGLKSQAYSMLLNERSPFEILEVRKVIESYAAAEAANNAAPEQIAEIGMAVQSLNDSAVKNQEWNEVADRQFHLAVVNAAGNSVLTDLISILLDMSQQRVWAKLKELGHLVPGSLEKNVADHRQIYEAIRARDPEAARNEVLKHFVSVEHDIFDL